MSLRRRMQRYRKRTTGLRQILRGGPIEPVEPPPWMSMEEFERRGAPRDAIAMQTTVCATTGELFVRAINGRYRWRPRKALLERRDELEEVVDAFGGSTHFPEKTPLWQQVEYLENVLDFEAVLPCGCKGEEERATA